MKKTEDFLAQIPSWESKYKKSDELEINFSKDDWLTAPAEFNQKSLHILGCAVMEDWETPYMKDLAEIACQNGGIVLELGFGMGISASFIQSYNIEEHIIIEANQDVANKAREFSLTAPRKTTIIEGLWENVIDMVADESISGILFDTYPLSEEELYQNHLNFFDHAFRKLKKGGVFTYFSDEIDRFGEVHLKRLKAAGFAEGNISCKISNVLPPADCEYWKANTILAPVIIK